MAWRPVDPESSEEMPFGGRVQKLVSLLAGRASSKFALEMVARLPDKAAAGAVPSMDCRVWQFPTPRLAAACFLWREADATKNSVAMLASKHFKHGELQGKSVKERREMLMAIGVDWAALDPRLKRGSYFFRRRVERTLTPDELAKIPEGRRPEGGVAMRSALRREDLPPLGTLANRVEVLLEGAVPVTLSELAAKAPAEQPSAPKPSARSKRP